MKVCLLHPDRDNALVERLPWDLNDLLAADLELPRLYTAMAAGDSFLLEVAHKVLAAPLTDPDVIVHRQQVLADTLANQAVVQELYDLATDATEVHRKVFLGGMLFRDPGAVLRRAVRVLEFLSANLKQLRTVTDRYGNRFSSPGFQRFLTMVGDQLSDDYLSALDAQLAELHLPRGTLLSARLGLGNKGFGHMLHQPPKQGWWEKLTRAPRGNTFTVDERDQAGSEALTDLTGRAINDVANVASQSGDHVRGFFARLRTELAFYLGCANLRDQLTQYGVTICYPAPDPVGQLRASARGLRDAALCLATEQPGVGNDLAANGKTLIMVTGANEGGKSTFLRAVGLAQVMMQAGMFVTATSYRCGVCTAVLTHFKRGEDASLTHGKLDEELARMSRIADCVTPGALLLCNESFASTNEREGTQIARDVVAAMVESGVRVVYVTHLYDLARSLAERNNPHDLFLRAQRRPDGTRTFRLQPGPPRPTSHGMDSFRRVFGEEPCPRG